MKKPITEAPVEQIKRVNLTGMSDDELFGPAFLYKEPECYSEKQVIPANPVQMNMEPDYTSEDEYEYEVYEEIQCGFCGQGVHPEEEQDHIDALHKKEEEELYKK